MYNYGIELGPDTDLITTLLKKHLSPEYIREWYYSDTVFENPEPYYDWKARTGGTWEEYKVLNATQRGYMKAAIAAVQEELSNAV